MDSNTKTAKLVQFANDGLLSSAIKEVFNEEFLKKSSDRDVQNLAARFIALELLEKTWGIVMSYKSDKPKEDNALGNLGL